MWNAIPAERQTSDLFGSGSKEDSMSLRPWWINGTTLRVSFIRFAPRMGISIFSDKKHRHPTGPGTWFHSARQESNADTWVALSSRPRKLRCEALQNYSTATFVPF
jgi:hypothetical protein